MSLLALAAAPPLDPSREVARGWARQELADPVYAAARPGAFQRAVQWALDHLDRLRVPSSALADPRTGVVLLVLVVVVVAGVVLLRTGRLRGPGQVPRERGLFEDVVRSADAHRRLADAAAAQGRLDDAVRERFRAVVRSLEERVVLDERPGRTADEAAAEAGRALPTLADRLVAGARLFDDVSYGDRPARAEHDAALRALDADVSTARPLRRAEVSAAGAR